MIGRYTNADPRGRARQCIGRAAEDAALVTLQSAGLNLIARNYRCRRGELDLVLTDGGILVFAEVRYRAQSKFGDGAASITASKRSRIIAAAAHFLGIRYRDKTPPCRFDVLSVSPPALQVEWIRDAFGLDF
ncbi:MAG: YraN family protein [Pseudomonadales bacterium]